VLRLAAALPLAALPLGAAPGRAAAGAPEALAPADRVRLLAARGDEAGSYRVAGLDGGGGLRFDLRLPERGHGIAVHPNGRLAVCVARRPGDYLLAIDLDSGAPAGLHRLPENRHCAGHAVFSPDGGLIYTTETDTEGGQGRIGCWETGQGLSRLGDLPSHGLDPHELLISPDGERLICANGGILTRPETGRTKLNLDTMAPSLVYLDRRDGRPLDEVRPPAELHRLSIRHLALTRDGTVCAALQYEGPAQARPPLVAFHSPGGPLRLAPAPPEVQAAMRNYCGSVAADPSGDWLAVSSPRGNLVTFWGADGSYRGSTGVADGCGLAPGDAPGTFVISSGTGTIHRHDCRTGHSDRLPGPERADIQWDNHLTRRA
jgi:hypothetical protein